MSLEYAKRRKGLPRLGKRLRGNDEVRLLAFGGRLTYDGYYLAALARTLGLAYPAAIFETATRGLGHSPSERAVFRTRSVLEMNPDLALIEFASEDMENDPAGVERAVEGMVRQLRATNPDREIAFVYFGSMLDANEGQSQKIVAAWERVAEYYGIPAFDCLALARWFIEKEIAVWFERWPGRKTWDDRRVLSLTVDGVHHTAAGGSLFGAHIAQSLISICNPDLMLTQSELPPPLLPGALSDAIFISASQLAGNGWIGGPLAEVLYTSAVAKWFDELSAADRLGARLRIVFEGRHAVLWTLGTGGSIAVTLDGVTRELPPDADNLHHGHELLNEETNRRHVLEIEARALPAVIAGVDLLGRLVPETVADT